MQGNTSIVEHQDNPAPAENVSLHQRQVILPKEQPSAGFQGSCFTTEIPTPKVYSVKCDWVLSCNMFTIFFAGSWERIFHSNMNVYLSEH